MRSAFYVAQRLGVSRSTVYRLAQRHELQWTRVAGLMRFEDTEIERYIARHTKPAHI
jgi:excisionase family DNA binding protein